MTDPTDELKLSCFDDLQNFNNKIIKEFELYVPGITDIMTSLSLMLELTNQTLKGFCFKGYLSDNEENLGWYIDVPNKVGFTIQYLTNRKELFMSWESNGTLNSAKIDSLDNINEMIAKEFGNYNE